MPDYLVMRISRLVFLEVLSFTGAYKNLYISVRAPVVENV
jgi:hypothetical protein